MTNVDWLETLSPWPRRGSALERMRALLAELGDPQAGLPADPRRRDERQVDDHADDRGAPARRGGRAGAYLSPHVRSWGERIRVDGARGRPRAGAGRRPAAAERLEATQFEALTAAAFVAFRAAGVEVAAVEAGLGGRHDATNVLDATRVVVLTNVSLEHTDVLGTTREAIAAEKLAVVHAGCTVVLGEPEWEDAARAAGAGEVVIAAGGSPELALEAVRAFLGRDVDPRRSSTYRFPAVSSAAAARSGTGRTTPRASGGSSEHLPPDDYTVMASILADKDVDGMLEGLAALGRRFVACRSSSPRALPAAELARRARPRSTSSRRETIRARLSSRAHELGEPVLVTGSLYLLADLETAGAEEATP